MHFYQTLLLWAKFDFDNGNFFEDFAQCVGAFSAYLYYVDSRAKHVCSEQQLTAVQFSHFVVKFSQFGHYHSRMLQKNIKNFACGCQILFHWALPRSFNGTLLQNSKGSRDRWTVFKVSTTMIFFQLYFMLIYDTSQVVNYLDRNVAF